MLTEQQIAEIEARFDKATPAKHWGVLVTSATPKVFDAPHPIIRADGDEWTKEIGAAQEYADAIFMAFAYRDIPALLADRRELLARIATLQAPLVATLHDERADARETQDRLKAAEAREIGVSIERGKGR